MSTLLSCASCVVVITLLTPTTEDGVSAFVIVNTCCVACARSFAPTVKISVRVPNVYPTLLAVGVELLGVVNAIVGALLVPDVSVDGDPPSVKRQLCCAPDSAGITSTTLPPVSTRPAVVNVTVASDSKPGVSVAVANVAPASVPDVIASVAIGVGPSMTAPWPSLLVTVTVPAATTEDGVRVFVTCISCATLVAIAFVATTIVSVLVAASHAVDSADAEPVEGVVQDAAGLSNDHPVCTPATSGITISIRPPIGISPVAVKDKVAASLKPGVSVAVLNALPPTKLPATMLLISIADVVSIFLTWESRVVACMLVFAATEDGVMTFVTVNAC